MSYQLWDHQKKAIEVAKDRDNFALFFDVGTGKTATAIQILREWCMKENRVLSVLVLCPPIVIRQWAEEIARFSKLGPYVVQVTGDGKKRLKIIRERKDKPTIFVTNYETLNMAPCFHELHNELSLDVLICDESHKLKSSSAKRTKQTTILSDRIRRKLLLTGTPILQSPMDIFSQFRILDGGRSFGKNFFVFRAQYFYDKNANMPKTTYFPDWRPRPGIEEKLNWFIYQKAMRAKKDDCLDLPPLVKTEFPIELSSKQESVYDEMKNDLVVFLNEHGGEGVSAASIALTKVLRLQQIVSGFISASHEEDNSDLIHEFEETPRDEALLELLEQITPAHKVIVWACFKQNYKRIGGICERLGLKYVEIHGEKTAKQKQESVDAFRGDDGVRVCIANQKAGGVGLNLIEASYSIYYSRTYSLEDDIQSEARNYRGGSERHQKITRIDLVARDTIDDIILDALKKKQNLAERILDIKNELK